MPLGTRTPFGCAQLLQKTPRMKILACDKQNKEKHKHVTSKRIKLLLKLLSGTYSVPLGSMSHFCSSVAGICFGSFALPRSHPLLLPSPPPPPSSPPAPSSSSPPPSSSPAPPPPQPPPKPPPPHPPPPRQRASKTTPLSRRGCALSGRDPP